MRADSAPGMRTTICCSVHGRRRRPGVDEAAPARLGRVGALRVAVVHGGALLHDLVEPEQAALLALPLLQPVAEQLLAAGARLGIGAVGAAVHPAAAALQREDPGRRRAEQVAVVGDQQDRLLRGRDPAPPAPAWRARRGSCRARRAAAPARRRRSSTSSTSRLRSPPESAVVRAGADVVEAGADDPAAGRVPLALELVAAVLRPVARSPRRGACRRRPRRRRRPGRARRRASSRPPRAAAAARARAASRARCARRRRPRRRPAACRRTGRRPRRPPAPPGGRRGSSAASTCRRRWRRPGRRARPRRP